MQAHALTPRLVRALQNSEELDITSIESSQQAPSPATINIEPEFPFLSVLASGGHTLLIHSASLTDHRVMAGTNDIAVGECLDKIARSVLPPQILQTARSTMYGALLESFAFPETPIVDTDKRIVEPEIEKRPSKPEKKDNYRLEDSTAREYCAIYGTRYTYVVPKNHEEALKQNTTKWGWGFNQPLTKAAGGLKSRSMEMSFSGLMTAVERVARYQMDQSTGKLTKNERSTKDISIEERRDMAREAMRAAFEHVASRVVLGLQQITLEKSASHTAATVVVAGGVAANSYLRYMYEPLCNDLRNTDSC